MLATIGAEDEITISTVSAEAGIPAEFVLAVLEKEKQVAAASPDISRYVADRTARMRSEISKAERDLASLVSKHGMTREAALAGRRIALARKILSRMGGTGLGVLPVLAAVPWISIALAASILAFAGYFLWGEGGKAFSDALKTAANVALVAGSFLGLLYFAKVASDIWTAPSPGSR